MKNKIYVLSIVISAILLSACNGDNKPIIGVTQQSNVEPPIVGWNIKSQGIFYAGYDNNRREILLITTPDGREFLAITGCGVTEYRRTGGKTKRTVEE